MVIPGGVPFGRSREAVCKIKGQLSQRAQHTLLQQGGFQLLRC